jgi:signal transduction histidine kinase
MAGKVRSAEVALGTTKEELRALAASLMTVQEDERRRIARELHDDLTQRLAVIDFELEKVRQELPAEGAALANAHLTTIRSRLTALTEDVRNLSHRLHPSIIEDLGLEVALRRLVHDFQRAHGIAIRCTTRSFDRPAPLPVETALYRIAQEALRNAAKHAPHALVTVTLSSTNDELRLTIEDDGPGFDVAEVRSKRGLGLVSIEERARLIGGHVDVRSVPCEGTEIVVRVRSAGREHQRIAT